MTPQEELAALRRLAELEDKAKAAQTAEPSFMDKVADFVPDAVKNVGTAAYKGIAGIATGAMDALNGSHDITDIGSVVAGKPVRQLDTSMPATRALESTGYQPKTGAERYVNSAVRGAVGALSGPGTAISNPIRAGLVGAGSGIGSQVGTETFKDTEAQPYAAVVGALVGGAGTGAVTAPMRNRKELANMALRGIKEQELTSAKQIMKNAKTQGVDINLDQAIGRDTNVTNVVNALVGHAEGQPLANQLRDQTAQVQALAHKAKKALPGQVLERPVLANDSQKAATDVLTAARQKRTAVTKPLYDQSGTMDPKVLSQFEARLEDLIKKHPNTNKTKLFEGLLGTIKDFSGRAKGQPTGLLDAQGNPIMTPKEPIDIQQFNDALRTASANSKNVYANSAAPDRESVLGLQREISYMRGAMGRISPKFKQANDTYKAITEREINPLKKGVIGRVSGLRGATDDTEAVNKLLPLIEKGRNPDAKTSDILKFAEKTKGSPVFQNAVKTHFSNVIASAEEQVNGKLSPSIAASIEKNLMGDAHKRQGLLDGLRGIALQNGDRTRSLEKGFMAAMEIISVASKRPGSIGPSGAAIAETAGSSKTAEGLRLLSLNFGTRLGGGYQRALSGDAYRALAENLTTPEGVAKLQQLAKLPIMSRKAQVLVADLTATASIGNERTEVKNLTPAQESEEN